MPRPHDAPRAVPDSRKRDRSRSPDTRSGASRMETDDDNNLSAGNSVMSSDGGLTLSRAMPWTGYEHRTYTENVCKRMIINTTPLLGIDGNGNDWHSHLVLPLNIMEFWFGKATANAIAMAPQVASGGLFKIKSLKVRISNLIIFEDKIDIVSGTEITTTSHNDGVYSIVQPIQPNNAYYIYNNLTQARSVETNTADNVVSAPSSVSFARGQIVDKTQDTDMTDLPELEFWRPNDPPKEYNVNCNNNVWIRPYGGSTGSVRQLPLQGDISLGGTTTYNMTTAESNIQGVHLGSQLVDGLRIGVPRLYNSEGDEAKYRLSVFVETDAVIEKRVNHLTTRNQDSFFNSTAATLAEFLVTDTANLNPPKTSMQTVGYKTFVA